MSIVTNNQKIKALFWLMRPLNSITASIAVFVASFLALNPNNQPFDFLTYIFIGSAAYFTTAQANTHNDIVDIEVDKINSPERALPSNIISLKEAKIWAIFLFAMAAGSGIIIDIRLDLPIPFSTFWAIFNSLLLDSYNKWFKKSGIWGNMVVAYVVWALFLYSDLLLNRTLTLRTEAIGLYAFFLNWGREVIKGIRDIEGDRDGGVNTIAVRFGARGAAIAGSILLLIGGLWTLPLIFDWSSGFLTPILLIIFNGIVAYRCINLIKDPTPEYATSTKILFLKMMLFALIILSVDQLILYVF